MQEPNPDPTPSTYMQTLEKISGPFVALWVIWMLISTTTAGWRYGLRAALQGLVVWALIAVVVWGASQVRRQPHQDR